MIDTVWSFRLGGNPDFKFWLNEKICNFKTQDILLIIILIFYELHVGIDSLIKLSRFAVQYTECYTCK